MLTRFAPSPTGYLHLGHALAAKTAFDFGPCLLRIEDIDHTRSRPEYVRGIGEDLRWLGFTWPNPVRRQSLHLNAYAGVTRKLLERGFAYPCRLTRAEIKHGDMPTPRAPKPAEMAIVADGPTALPFAIRLDMKKALFAQAGRLEFLETGPRHEGKYFGRDILTEQIETDGIDPIIARKDIGTSYTVAVTHDDAYENITDIVRGEDLFTETALQVLLQKLLDYPTPRYHHHTLIRHRNGEKLAKSRGDLTLRSLRKEGKTPQEVIYYAQTCGLL